MEKHENRPIERVAVNGQDKAATAPLLIDIAELGRLLTRSRAALERDLAAGKLPRPLKLGRSNRWRLAEIEDWIKAGAPSLVAWEAIKAANR